MSEKEWDEEGIHFGGTAVRDNLMRGVGIHKGMCRDSRDWLQTRSLNK